MTTHNTNLPKPTNPPPQTTKPTRIIKSTKLSKPTRIIQPTKPSQCTNSDKSNKPKLPNKSSISRRPCTRSATRGFKSKVFNNEVFFEVSSDSYDSAEDSLFRPGLDEDSSFDSDTAVNIGSRIRKNKVQTDMPTRNVNSLTKGKDKILLEDDTLVFFVCMRVLHFSRVNKQLEDFCHRWLTIQSYMETYNYHIHPIPGQPLWEQADDCNRPHTPKIKKKLEKLKIKRRMDVDEKGTYKRRGCKKKMVNDASTAVTAAKAAEKKKNDGSDPAPEQQVEQPQDDGDQGNGENNSVVQLTDNALPTIVVQPVQIQISQPTASETEDSQQLDPSMKRPSKLSPRRRSFPLAISPIVNLMQENQEKSQFHRNHNNHRIIKGRKSGESYCLTARVAVRMMAMVTLTFATKAAMPTLIAALTTHRCDKDGDSGAHLLDKDTTLS
ncbi:hypothetical protein Ahy_B06g084696 [Arachis hypogaea]|uniref:Uncharacterized protein n=1 Tax=Arachis hypogaea TaxID=3818 RepID=A0A444YSI7_ARAHY|nr:hypothetical protein Ahy_B06g084696 [Arachis hypogaea]